MLFRKRIIYKSPISPIKKSAGPHSPSRSRQITSNSASVFCIYVRLFVCLFFPVVKKAMAPKLCLVVMLIILGTFTVQGESPRNKKKNSLEVFARQSFLCECFFDPFRMTLCSYNFF